MDIGGGYIFRVYPLFVFVSRGRCWVKTVLILLFIAFCRYIVGLERYFVNISKYSDGLVGDLL